MQKATEFCQIRTKDSQIKGRRYELNFFFFFFCLLLSVAQQTNSGLDLLTVEISRSHHETHTHTPGGLL
jgi:hypothetical protein